MADASHFEAPLGGSYRLSSEREPAARSARNAPGPSFSWCPAQPGANIIGVAASDAGFLVYHVGDTLVFFDQKGSHPSSSDQLQLQEAVTCHDMHWSAGSGAPDLEAVVSLGSGEVLLWHPLARREPSRGLSAAISPAIAGGGGGSVLCIKWRPGVSPPSPGAVCLAAAGIGGRISLFARRAAIETPPPSPSRRAAVRAATARRGRGLFGLLGVLRASEAGAAVTALAFSPDGAKLAAATADGLIAVYRLGGEGEEGLAGREGSVGHCSISSVGSAARASVSSVNSGGGSGGGNGGWCGYGGGGAGGGGVASGSAMGIVSPDSTVERVWLLFRLRSYFGGVLCLAWSGDGMCLVGGGEDDLISIVSVAQGRVVARAQGHRSWVLHAAFQPAPEAKHSLDVKNSLDIKNSFDVKNSLDAKPETRNGPDAKNSPGAKKSSEAKTSLAAPPRSYSFASVGADGLLAFWDFSPPAGFHTGPLSLHSPHSTAAGKGSPADAVARPGGAAPAPVPAPAFRAVPLLSPVVLAAVDPQPVSGLLYGRAVLLVASSSGHLRTFARTS